MEKIYGEDILKIGKLQKEYEKMLNIESATDIYPDWWYQADYKFRINVIDEAISKKTAIRNLERIKEMEHKANISYLYTQFNSQDNKHKKV